MKLLFLKNVVLEHLGILFGVEDLGIPVGVEGLCMPFGMEGLCITSTANEEYVHIE